MKINIISFLATIVPFIVIDALWLTTMSKKLYAPYLSHILSDSPKLTPALLFYIIYSVGLVVFVSNPSMSQHASTVKILLLGSFFGAVAYATYDLTNHATLNDWPVIITLVDILWGAFATGIVSLISIHITKYFI